MKHPRKPTALLARAPDDPFLSHISLKLYDSGGLVTVTPLHPVLAYLKKGEPLLSYTFTSLALAAEETPEPHVLRATAPAQVIEWAQAQFSKAGTHRLVSLRECDHQPVSEEFYSSCKHCGQQIDFFLQKNEELVTLQEGWQVMATSGQFLGKGQPIASKGDQNLPAPTRVRIMAVEQGVVRYRRVNCRHDSVCVLGICDFCGQRPQRRGRQYLAIGERGSFLDGQLATKLQRDYISNLLEGRKLVLILDLDNTIIHSEKLPRGTDLSGQSDFMECSLQTSQEMVMVIKYRPHLPEFLKAVLPLYDVFVYTAATRAYAQIVCRGILDNFQEAVKGFEDVLSRERIMSRSDHYYKLKTLENLLPSKAERMTLILDDQPLAWAQTDCIVPTKPFFHMRYSEQHKEVKFASKEDRFLLDAAVFLTLIHQRYYQASQPTPQDLPDIRSIKTALLSSPLRGMVVYFQAKKDHKDFGAMAEYLGAQVVQTPVGANLLILEQGSENGRDGKRTRWRKGQVRMQSRVWLRNLYFQLGTKQLLSEN